MNLNLRRQNHSYWFVFLIGVFAILNTGAYWFDRAPAKRLRVYFIRHAETLANKTGLKTEENYRSFSTRGLKQIDVVTEVLSKITIDHVIVSPTFRTRHTVLPYLKKTGKKAEIWPELEEWRMKSQLPVDMTPDSLKIEIEPENRDYFTFRDLNSTKLYYTENYEGGIRQIQKIFSLIRERFSGSGKSILLVGHSNSGSRVLEHLSGQEMIVRYHLKTARLNLLEETDSGHFKIVMLNGDKFQPGG